VTAALLLITTIASVPSDRSRIQIDDSSECLNRAELTGALERRLEESTQGSELSIVVTGSRVVASVRSEIAMRVLNRRGHEVLDRHFVLKPAECASSTSLLDTVLENFLTRLVEIEVHPPHIERPEPTGASVLRIDLGAQVLGAFFPTNGEAELRLMGGLGSMGHGVSLTTLLRMTLPQSLGTGRFYEGAVLAGIGWQYRASGFLVRLEVRAGALGLFGTGYDRAHSVYLPWIEGALDALFSLGPVLIGPEVSGSPLSDPVEVAGESGSTGLSRLRVGLVLALPVFREEM
jgi:hypothetical protein